MSTPRRVIKIRMNQRVAEDSRELLTTVADVFTNDDIELDIKDSPRSIEKVDTSVAKEAEEGAKAALELENQAVRSGMVKPSSPAENKTSTHKWLGELLLREGVRVAVREVFDAVKDALIGRVT